MFVGHYRFPPLSERSGWKMIADAAYRKPHARSNGCCDSREYSVGGARACDAPLWFGHCRLCSGQASNTLRHCTREHITKCSGFFLPRKAGR
jgi:hypothetical protein